MSKSIKHLESERMFHERSADELAKKIDNLKKKKRAADNKGKFMIREICSSGHDCWGATEYYTDGYRLIDLATNESVTTALSRYDLIDLVKRLGGTLV